ncbi:hypothetical protein [Streptomyces sp. NPDC001492]
MEFELRRPRGRLTRPGEGVRQPKIEPDPHARGGAKPYRGPESRPPIERKPGPDLGAPVFEVGPLTDAKTVLGTALRRLGTSTTPLTLEEVNEQVKDLAITFHRFDAGDRSAIAVACPLERKGPTGYDAASAAITALHGHVDAAALQMVHAATKGDDSLAAGTARCVISGFLIHLMPTSVIGKAITMLAEAVRGINARTELKEITEARDFVATQGVGELLRHAKNDEITDESFLPDRSDGADHYLTRGTPPETVSDLGDLGDPDVGFSIGL